MYRRYRDPQDAVPTGYCENCGREIYDYGRLCGGCHQKEEWTMSMKELAKEYRQSAALLGTRIDALCAELPLLSGSKLDRVNHRLSDLCKLYRQTMQTARELERYEG